MAHEQLQRTEQVRALSNRAFGFAFAGVFLALGLLPVAFGSAARPWSLALSAAFLLLAAGAPSVLEPLNRVWMQVGALMNRVVHAVTLAIMFFLVVTPTGLLMRFLGKSPLQSSYDRSTSSYWMRRTATNRRPQNYDRQF
jgi:hypothetical protein